MKTKESRALLDVWDAKRTVHEETRHLTGAAYFHYIREQAARLFPGIRNRTTNTKRWKSGAYQETTAPVVAEDKTEYSTKKADNRPGPNSSL